MPNYRGDPTEPISDREIASRLSQLLGRLPSREGKITRLLILAFSYQEVGKLCRLRTSQVKEIAKKVGVSLRDEAPELSFEVANKIARLGVRNRIIATYFQRELGEAKERLDAILRKKCQQCGNIFKRKLVGRPPKWCSGKCRTAAYRARN
ncbi:MAG TPA: hypothetical protein VFQ77_17585 [Pseudonocardiaceae bacterium]|jgi:hypothetical protein|nr:hypothetical protein [Pseudonocardiaceae bacterium]